MKRLWAKTSACTNLWFLSAFLTVLLTFNSFAQCDSVYSGLAGYFPFDGTPDDQSGNGHLGLINGASLATDRFGNPNSAFFFNGTGDYITSTPLNYTGSSASISVWVQPINITSRRYYNITWQGPSPANMLLAFQNFGTILSFGIHTSLGYSELDVPITAGNYVDGEWHCITAVYDGSQMWLYADGNLIGNQPMTGTIVPAAPLFSIGSMNNSKEYFYGRIDELKFYDRALDSAEVFHSCSCDCVSSLSVDLGDDMLVCIGDSVTLDAGEEGDTYRWQDGSSNRFLSVTQAGQYWVEVSDSCGSVDDTINVTYVFPPMVDLGKDTAICLGNTIVLNASYLSSTYRWQDNSNASFYTVSTPGTYWVEVSIAGCVDSDTIHVSIDSCLHELNIPNVFSPDGDGINELFSATVKGIAEVHTVIYNRWGQLIFETNNPSIDWDGLTSSGKPASEGVYFWLMTYTDPDGTIKEINGHLTLFRKGL